MANLGIQQKQRTPLLLHQGDVLTADQGSESATERRGIDVVVRPEASFCAAVCCDHPIAIVADSDLLPRIGAGISPVGTAAAADFLSCHIHWTGDCQHGQKRFEVGELHDALKIEQVVNWMGLGKGFGLRVI